MPRVEHVVFAVEVPGEVRETRSLKQAMDWVEDLLVERGHEDGFVASVSVCVDNQVETVQRSTGG